MPCIFCSGLLEDIQKIPCWLWYLYMQRLSPVFSGFHLPFSLMRYLWWLAHLGLLTLLCCLNVMHYQFWEIKQTYLVASANSEKKKKWWEKHLLSTCMGSHKDKASTYKSCKSATAIGLLRTFLSERNWSLHIILLSIIVIVTFTCHVE